MLYFAEIKVISFELSEFLNFILFEKHEDLTQIQT